MARYHDIESQMASLDIEEEENESFVLEEDVEEGSNRYELCLVGRFLTEKTINLRAMRTKMADVWKPAMGISIKELEQGIYLFQFFHKEDMQWVVKGGPWTFDNVMLALEPVAPYDDPVKVPLWFVNIWIQIHELPMGFMTEAIGKQLGNFFGEFIEYDSKNNTSIWRECMRVRIRLDVRKPLKRKKKIVKKDGSEFTVTCKYERIGEFCFLCGLVSHTDRFCRKFIDKRGIGGEKEWGVWLKASPRRAANQSQSRWLRDEGDATWGGKIGGQSNYHDSRDNVNSNAGIQVTERSNYRRLVSTETTASISEKQMAGYITNSNSLFELNEEENNGLKIDERKRRRGDPSILGRMDIDMGLSSTGPHFQVQTIEADISTGDLAASTSSIEAELAQQASRPQ